MTIAATIAKLSGFVGVPFVTNQAAIENIIIGDGFVYRWLPTGEGVNLSEFRADRVNILCGPITGNALTSALVQAYTVG